MTRGIERQNIKIITVLFIALLIDTLRPFGYSLYTEFLFVGIIFLFIHYHFSLALVLSAVFGYLKDAVSQQSMPLSLIEFVSLAFISRYIHSRLPQKIAKRFIIFSATAVHLVLNSINRGEFALLFSFLFFIHTVLIFYLADYLLQRWITSYSQEYT